MSVELTYYLGQYGYMAIFLLVFLQEVGAPNPIPNEFLLIVSGYFVHQGIINFGAAVCAALLGDLLAGAVVYLLFYNFSTYLSNSNWKFISRMMRTLRVKCRRFSQQNVSGIIIGRLSPFIRGYVAVACGLIRLRPKTYFNITLVTTPLWCCFYIGCGYLVAPYWQYINDHIVSLHFFLLIILVCYVLWLLVNTLSSRRRKKGMTRFRNLQKNNCQINSISKQ